MSGRNRLLVIDEVIPAPLAAALERRGLVLVHATLATVPDDLHGILGCAIWFYDGLRSPWRVWRLARRLRQQNIPLFAWNRDAPHYLNRASWRLDWYNRAQLLDLYATHTLADARRFADTWMYLPNAADVSRYNLAGTALNQLRDDGHYTYDVSFFGAMDGARYKEMRNRQEFFTALGERLRSLGIHYLFQEASGMGVEDQIALIQTSRINLNYGASCEYGAPFASGLPERCYGIPACGGFLLCDKRSHASNDFTPGENWAEFDGLDDCVAKITYWLANFTRARGLAERCHAHVMARHTYDQRAEQLHEALLAWHDGQRGRLT